MTGSTDIQYRFLINSLFLIAEIGAFLLYTLKVPYYVILGRSLDPDDTSQTHMVQVTGSADMYDIDFDMQDGFIYWTEAMDHEHQNDRALVSHGNIIVALYNALYGMNYRLPNVT